MLNTRVSFWWLYFVQRYRCDVIGFTVGVVYVYLEHYCRNDRGVVYVYLEQAPLRLDESSIESTELLIKAVVLRMGM